MGRESKKRLWMMTIMIIVIQIYGCLKDEKNALLLIKPNSLLPSFWSYKKSHNASDDCCDWEGVTCDKRKYIISLNFDCKRSNIRWDLNASLFLPFHHLRKLDFSNDGCSIQNWIDDEGSIKLSSKLTKLEELNLRHNMLENTIFSQLKGFHSLKRLYLSENKLRGTIFLHEIEAVSKNLEELELSSNYITSILDNDGCRQNHKLQNYQLYGSTSCFRHLSSLKLLNISDNQIFGEIPLWIQNITSLEILDLSVNQLRGNVNLSPIIHLRSLTLLEISYNYFEIPITFLLFSNHTKMKYFFGDSNQAVHQISSLENFQTFTLGLIAFSMFGCGLSVYPNILYHQEHLRLINLSDNIIDAEFPSWLLNNNSRMETLILSNNSLFGPLHLHFLTPIPSMGELFVDHNKIHGLIPENIGLMFPKLDNLDLSSNEFKGDIPSSLSELKSLRVLQLSNNYLSGGVYYLSKSCVNLLFVDLSNNDYQEEIPSFHQLKFLSFLSLKQNKFSGYLKTNMFGPTIGALLLSNNFLEGQVPEDIGNLSTLYLLDLSFNKFNGPLPKFSSMPNLVYLYLNNNKFNGHIDDMFCKLCVNLEQMDVSNNDLIGHIPPSIGNLTNLRTLMMRGNLFYGEIPIQLCQLFHLYFLDLSSNDLHGSIPTCFGHIPFSWNSEVIGLFINFHLSFSPRSLKRASTLIYWRDYENEHIGQIFIKVELTTKNMTYNYKGGMLYKMSGIDLSCNKLTGQIPHELGNLSYLLTLNVSHNKLWGPIPPSFSNLKNIESLDFSCNKLNGSIPEAFSTLNTLEFFKVAYNNLSGRIPFAVQFSTFEASSYKGNPLLCGPPLTKICTTSKSSSSTSKNALEDEDKDGEWIDMETFYVTFTVSAITMFLVVVIIMLINPYWRDAWFYIVKSFITLVYYFIQDCIRKLRRVRSV